MLKIEKIISIEKLRKIGFRRKWNSDKSAHWWSMKVNHPVLGNCELILDDCIVIDVLVLMKTKARASECIAYIKCTEKSIRDLFNMFGLEKKPIRMSAKTWYY